MAKPAGETLIYDVIEAIYNMVELTDEHFTEVLSDLNLTRPQSDVVWVLDPNEPAITMGALAAKLRCEPSTATFVVEKLVEKGLLQRGSDPRDRRRTTVALTAEGISAQQRLTHAVTTGSPIVKLSPEELAVIDALLAKALVGMRKKYRM